MVNFTILAGGFATFVATYVFDSDVNSLTLVKQTQTGENPSWIASHPQNSSILYAVNEVSPVGNLQSFLVDADGGITLVDTVASGGGGTTFTNPLSTGEVSAMNFGSASCSLVATDPENPLIFKKDSPAVDFPVNGGPSNPHQSLEFNGEVFVPDLGADKIWRLVNDGAPGVFKVHGQIDVEPGNGPRHIAIQNGILFTVNELTSTLTAQQIPQAPNGTTLPLIANVSIVPSDVTNLNTTFRGAEILISEPSKLFPDPLIYVSNRNLGPNLDPRGDSIAIFEFKGVSSATPSASANPTDPTEPPLNSTQASVRRRHHSRHLGTGHHLRSSRSSIPSFAAAGDASLLSLQTQVFTGLQQIRGMALGRVADGGEEFLIAGANTDGGVAVFRRTDGGRNLVEAARNKDVANRTSFVFL